MLYKFKSKATGDVIMLGPNGDALLRALGRTPAPKGIVEPADMPAAIAAGMSAGSMMPLGAGARPMARISASPVGPIMMMSPLALLLNL